VREVNQMGSNLQPGLELDALVIRKVLDLPVFRYHREAEERWGKAYTKRTYALCELGQRHVIYSPTGSSLFLPSTDIAHAWRVVERLQALRLALVAKDDATMTDEDERALEALSSWLLRMDSVSWVDLTAAEAAHRICILAVDAMWYKEG
jgi:hypothetical protein